jgi:hypothetical protein
VLSSGTLYHLLSNPVYIGKTLHKGLLHAGKHKPILDLKAWNQAADILKHNRVDRKRTRNVPSGRMLLGLLKTASGHTPTHAAKGGRRYFYYTLTSRESRGSENPIKRLWGRWMPESTEDYKVFLGEFFWSPIYRSHDDSYHGHNGWTNGRRQLPVKVCVTAESYLHERGYDCSIIDSLLLLLPSKNVV